MAGCVLLLFVSTKIVFSLFFFVFFLFFCGNVSVILVLCFFLFRCPKLSLPVWTITGSRIVSTGGSLVLRILNIWQERYAICSVASCVARHNYWR